MDKDFSTINSRYLFKKCYIKIFNIKQKSNKIPRGKNDN